MFRDASPKSPFARCRGYRIDGNSYIYCHKVIMYPSRLCEECRAASRKAAWVRFEESKDKEGQCYKCPNPKAEGHNMCGLCLVKHREHSARYHLKTRGPSKTVKRCTLCRETGHNATTCPKDPFNKVT